MYAVPRERWKRDVAAGRARGTLLDEREHYNLNAFVLPGLEAKRHSCLSEVVSELSDDRLPFAVEFSTHPVPTLESTLSETMEPRIGDVQPDQLQLTAGDATASDATADDAIDLQVESRAFSRDDVLEETVDSSWMLRRRDRRKLPRKRRRDRHHLCVPDVPAATKRDRLSMTRPRCTRNRLQQWLTDDEMEENVSARARGKDLLRYHWRSLVEHPPASLKASARRKLQRRDRHHHHV